MVDFIDNIKENVEKAEEAIEEIAEEIVEKVKGKKIKASEIKEPKKRKKKTESEEMPKEEKELAEIESVETEIKGGEKESLEERKKKLLERAKKLSEKVDETTSEELKEKVKVRKTEMLVPLEEYIKSGIYLGRRAVTPDMKPFVYRRRADGLAIFNTDLIDEKIKEAVGFLSKFNPEDVILVCKRQTGWKAAEMFSKITGMRVFTKKYPAGILTNPHLPNFTENELTIVTDSWLDKNALSDTMKVNKKILLVCDTNNFAKGADQIIIGNNKTSKSLGIIFYLLAKGYCKARNIEANIPDMEWWMSDEEEAPILY